MENSAAMENAAVSRESIFQKPRNPPIIIMSILSPYPNESSVTLLIIRKMTPTAAPAASKII